MQIEEANGGYWINFDHGMWWVPYESMNQIIKSEHVSGQTLYGLPVVSEPKKRMSINDSLNRAQRRAKDRKG